MPRQPQTLSADASDPGLDRLKAVLDGWRNSLLDMGGRNRLLNFRHTRTSTLEITSPAAGSLLPVLAKGREFAPVVEAGDEDRDAAERRADPGLVTQKATQATLDSALYQLRQKSGQMFNDYGLWVLWLGIGMLDWREDGAHEGSLAPLLLVPVELRRDTRRGYRLHLADNQDRAHNPALAVKLERMGVDWSTVTATDVNDLPALFSAARAVCARQKGWSVDERVVLGLFASHREAMYQDLQQNEDRILGHPLVRAVALGPDAGLPDDLIGFEPPELDRIDDVQLPEKTPLVLDADASQRQCIAAALDNRSFVMSGPPGTGKSQTITNMIAALMHAGRSVLFVSEKAAALDVVRNRLRGVGLGDFVMALHSGDTSKKAVATELARVLTTEARVTGAAEHELERARRLREELSAYAAGMNQEREPLRQTLHDVLGRLVQLERAGTPQLPLSARNAKTVQTLSAGALQELAEAAQAVSRAWRPAAEGRPSPGAGWSGHRRTRSPPRRPTLSPHCGPWQAAAPSRGVSTKPGRSAHSSRPYAPCGPASPTASARPTRPCPTTCPAGSRSSPTCSACRSGGGRRGLRPLRARGPDHRRAPPATRVVRPRHPAPRAPGRAGAAAGPGGRDRGAHGRRGRLPRARPRCGGPGGSGGPFRGSAPWAAGPVLGPLQGGPCSRRGPHPLRGLGQIARRPPGPRTGLARGRGRSGTPRVRARHPPGPLRPP